MTATAITFTINPPTRVDGGAIRFTPNVVNNLTPIATYSWNFGDGGVSATTTPIHTYTTISPSPYTFTASVTATDTNGYSCATSNFVIIGTTAQVGATPTDGTFTAVSVVIYDDSNSMVINRTAWGDGTSYGCPYYLLTPNITPSIDKIGVATFSVLNPGVTPLNDYMTAQAGLLAEGNTVLVIMGKDVVFSGIIRRVTQNTQSGFTSTTKAQLFDIECDSDLARLKKQSVASSALPTTGDIIIDSPANIFRRIMT